MTRRCASKKRDGGQQCETFHTLTPMTDLYICSIIFEHSNHIVESSEKEMVDLLLGDTQSVVELGVLVGHARDKIMK